MKLNIPPEPIALRDWMQSIKRGQAGDPESNWDVNVIWSGNKLPKYLWGHWKDSFRPLGINWQKFMRILRHRTDLGVMWYQGTLPWIDFIQEVAKLINGPIGQKASGQMPASKSSLPPQDLGALQIPAFSDWEPFERFCRELWSRIWMNPELQRHGRTGQAQAGIDVFGYIQKNEKNLGGVQCKKRDAFTDDSLTVEELQNMVADAKTFIPALREFVVAYTGKSDVKLQAEARRLTELNRTQDLFSVQVCSWDDIKDILGNYPELLEQFSLIATGVSAKSIEEVKQVSDSILKMQIEHSADTRVIAQDVIKAIDDISTVGELVKSMASGGGDLTDEYSREIDEIRDLINGSRPKEALDRIEELEKRLKPNVTAMIKFRILTNKAASLAALGDEQKAGLLFIEAFQYNPNDEKALCNKALGLLFIGQRNEAVKIVEKVLQDNQFSQRATELLVYTASPEDSLQSIIELIPEVLRTNESVACAIALAARNREMETENLYWLEIAINAVDPGKPEPDLWATLATSILQTFKKRHDVQLGLQVTSIDKEQLERVLALYNRAIGVLEHSETLRYRTHWIANRAVAHNLLGHPTQALADAELALRLDPDNPEFLRQKAFLLHEQGNNDDAISILNQIKNNPKVPEAELLLAGIYHELRDDDTTLVILEESVKNTEKPIDILVAEKRLLIHTHMRAGKADLARNIVNGLRIANPTSLIDIVLAARIEKSANNLNETNQLLNDALTYVTDKTPFRGMFDLAEELYELKRYADAWPLYENIVDPRGGSSLVNKLIYSYYEAEMYENALEAARLVPETAKSRFIYDIEVSILNSMGDVKSAILVSEYFLKAHPEDLAFRVKWAIFLLRDDQVKKLDDFLKGPIDLSQLPNDLKFEATKQLAWLYAQRNMSLKAIEIAYALRKEAPRSSDAHTIYMSIFFDREKTLDDQFSPKIVGVDTAVAVEEVGAPKRWYVIEDNPGTDKDTLGLQDPLAKRLMGLKVNDEIRRDEGKPSEIRLRIVEIKSKYIHALHETMAMFPHLFSEEENPPIQRFTLNPDIGDEAMRDQLLNVMEATTGRSEEHILRVEKLYKDGKITIGTFANLAGRDPITIWGGLINNSRVGIRCCAGTQAERVDAIKIVKESKSVAIDLTALLSLGTLDHLNLLHDNFDVIYIAQTTIDTLSQEIAQKRGMTSSGFLTVWKEGGQYFRHEVTAEDVQKQTTFLQKIRDWISENCKVASMTEILRLPRDQRDRLYETIGTSFVDTMMISKEHGCPLYSDDYGTRGIAQSTFDVKGFWTQILMIVSTERGFIGSESFEKSNITLNELNYQLTSMSGKTLHFAAKEAGWMNAEPFTKVLMGIVGTGIEFGSAMSVTIDFFYQLWKEPAVSGIRKEALVFTVLDALAQQNSRVEIINYAGKMIPERFRFAPIAEMHLLKVVAAWRSLRIL